MSGRLNEDNEHQGDKCCGWVNVNHLVLMANSRTKSLPLSMNFWAYIRISFVKFRNWNIENLVI